MPACPFLCSLGDRIPIAKTHEECSGLDLDSTSLLVLSNGRCCYTQHRPWGDNTPGMPALRISPVGMQWSPLHSQCGFHSEARALQSACGLPPASRLPRFQSAPVVTEYSEYSVLL